MAQASHSRRKQMKNHINMNGTFYIPPNETIRQMIDRLDEGKALGWPGSISIHGNMMRESSANKRRHEISADELARRKNRNRSSDSRPRGRQIITQRTYEAAKLYALADRTDPFAYNRAISHINNGICGTRNIDGEDKPCHYSAEEYTVNLGDGNVRKEYRNIIRP